jgi:signal transduction histidine kinase
MKILLVEDNRGDARLIQEMLEEVDAGEFELAYVESLAQALKHFDETTVDVILLDLSLPDSHGLDTFLKINNRVPAIPVVVLSGYGDETFAVEAVRRGAQDYLTKGQTDSSALVRALRYAVERQRTENAFVQAERLRALGAMASGIAHDFNNVLAVILGRVELAMEDVKDDKLKKDLQIIEKTAMDASSTVRRLQEFSRVRVGHAMEPVDIKQLVQDALQMVESRQVQLKQAGPVNIDIATELSQTDPVLGDAAELKQALVNIVFNSIDAMPQGGKVTVNSEQEDGFIVISVTDTGEGIPDEIKGRIFDPFFTTKGSKGLGLGLSVTYGIVNRHGGKIDFESTVGEGSTFTITLPAAGEVEQKAPVEAKVQAAASARILVVDDDPQVSEVLELMLKKLGHEVTVFNTGRKAVSAFKEDQYNMVITDLGMPDLTGREVAKAVKEKKPDTPVLLITGWGVQLELDEMPEIDGLIAKPFSKQVLSAKVAELLTATKN